MIQRLDIQTSYMRYFKDRDIVYLTVEPRRTQGIRPIRTKLLDVPFA